MRRHRQLAILAGLLALALLSNLGASAVSAKDFRTAFVRVVPETDWKPETGKQIAIAVVNGASHEDAGKFATAFTAELTEQLGRVLGYSVDPAATTQVTFTVSAFDPGNAGLRLGLGMGGKAYVGGTIEVREGDTPIGSLLYSFRPNLPGPEAMAREAAAGLALKLSNGERDQELHPLKTKKKE